MAKRFSDNIVADVFGKSFASTDSMVDFNDTAGRVQMTILLDSEDYEEVWDEVDRRRHDRRIRKVRGQYGTSHFVEEIVNAFLDTDVAVRDPYYDMESTGQLVRVGFRFTSEFRERIARECDRRVDAGKRRSRSTTTSVIAAAIRMFLDDDAHRVIESGISDVGVDEFSAGLVF